MALFKRHKQSSQAARDPDGESLASERRPRTIGELLSAARERHGATVEGAGAALRIRPAFLKAIEDGDYARLPGPVYALGFVRTYADYLGLDGEAFAQRFKNEGVGLEHKRDFSFPMPLPERGGIPGGALLLVALIIAACVYAVWYYRASGDRLRPERVAAVPEQLIPLPAPAPAATPPAATTPPEPTSAAAPESNSASRPSGGPEAPPPAAALQPASPPAQISALPSPTPAPTSATQAAPAVAETPAPPLAIPAPPAIPAVPAVAPAPNAPHVYGITNGPVRIVIKAAADSWVQVRDTNQSVLQMRVLKSGDSLRVPDRPDLTLRTGNAGALQITVDGKPVPAIGPFGKKRSASLEPERLIAGTAPLD
jgi:cytoskeleton protein RodZ